MKKTIFIVTLILSLFLQSILASAEENYIRTGFYINGEGTEDNLYLDIYTYLNNKREATSIISKNGLKNTIFVHQTGKGFTLDELFNSPLDASVDDVLRNLAKRDFATSYIDYSNGEKVVVNPSILYDFIEIEPSYYILPIIPNEFIDVLRREYPEFLINIRNAWPNDTDDDNTKDDKIVNLLEDVKAEVESYGEVTETNFDRTMYNSFKKVIMYKRHRDFRNAMFNAYGSQIDYSERNRKLHPDLIPLSEAIKGSVLNNHFTLLYDIDSGTSIGSIDLDEKVRDVIGMDDIKYNIEGNRDLTIDRYKNLFFNRRIENKVISQINISEADGNEINPPETLDLIVKPYIEDEVLDITSTTSDYDELTRKIKVLDENGQVIEDTVEEVLIYNITTGTVAKQELPHDQKISYVYVSTKNPKMDYMIYFKTVNDMWYKLSLTDYSYNGYLVNEYIEFER